MTFSTPLKSRLSPRGLLNSALVSALLLTLIFTAPAYSHERVGDPSLKASAAVAERVNQAHDLTGQLHDLLAAYQSAAHSAKSGLRMQMTALAEERHRLLGELIENASAEVLKQALPDVVLDRMPADAQAFLEQRLEMEGELQILHVDYTDDSQSHYVYLLTQDNGEQYSLHFARELPDLLSGARVRAKGLTLYGIKTRDAGETKGAVAVDDEQDGLILAEAGGPKNSGSTGSTSTTSSTLPNTLGAQKTLVILVNFSDNPIQPYTPASAHNVIFSTVSNFVLENSYQQTWLTGDVVGWNTIASSSTVCDTGAIATEAKNAASKVVNVSSYARLVYAFPQNNNCKWAGLASVGGNPSQAWVNGAFGVRVVAHELAHGLGLWHSNLLDCGAVTLGDNCKTVEYGDVVDTMGGPIGFLSAAHFNAFQKERLGWLNAGVSPEIITVLTDGTYSIENYESGGSAPKALKILKSTDPTTGKRTWYYLESRQAIGFDSFLATNSTIASYENITKGLLLHMGSESSGNSSRLLDFRPDTSTRWDPALAAGQSFNDPDAKVTLKTEWVTATTAAVTVSFGSGGGTTSVTPGSMTISTDQSSYARGQTVIATAMVISEGKPVANATVNFVFTKSNGSVVIGSGTTGSNGAVAYKLRLKNQDPVGTYKVAASGPLSGMSNSAATTFTVQ